MVCGRGGIDVSVSEGQKFLTPHVWGFYALFYNILIIGGL